jgi:DNA invertase Pin-like site-specific DNA recombinase
MATAKKRAALYVRVSTDQQTIAHQLESLRAVAERRGWQIVETYTDAGISGAKGRDKRPGLDAMLKDASRRRFDVVMAWAIDRLGRSLIDLLGTIQHLEAAGVDLYLDQQAIDTTTPMGRLLFQITGAFAEFERTMIRQRIAAGLKTVKAAIATKGSFTARSSGIVRKRLGRPGADPKKVKAARRELEKGTGVLRTAKLVGLGTGTVQRLKQASIREGVYCSKARAPSSRMGAIGMGTAPPLTTIHNETPGIRKARYMAGGRGRRSSMSSP